MSHCNKIQFVIFLFFLLTLIGTVPVSAQEGYVPPNIFITGLNITSQTHNKIEGNFKILNTDDVYYGSLNHEIQLLRQMPTEKSTISGWSENLPDDFSITSQILLYELMDAQRITEDFSVPPKQEIKKSFEYFIPRNIPEDIYHIRAEITLPSGSSSGGKTIELGKLKGENKFLAYKEERVVIALSSGAEIEYLPHEGINIDKNVVPKIKAVVYNPSDTAIKAFPKIIISQATGILKEVNHTKKNAITIEPKTIKILTFNLMKMEDPAAYTAVLQFYDENNNLVSGPAKFRWVVTGPSARILSVLHDKDGYLKNEFAKLSFWLVGSAENNQFSVKPLVVENLILYAKILNSKGQICGENQKSIAQLEDTRLEDLEIEIQRECLEPKIQAEIKTADRALSTLESGVETSKETKKSATIQKIRQIGIYAGIVVILISVFYFLWKRRKEGS